MPLIDTSMSFATPTDIMQRVDVRILGDLVSDDNVRQTPTQLLTNANLLAALSDASGRITTALLWAERYTVAQITALTGDDLNVIVRINCVLALAYLNVRRGFQPEKGNPGYEDGLKMLDAIKQGEYVLNVPAAVAAGGASTNYPSATTYQTVGLLHDRCTPGLFPPRFPQAPAPFGSN